MPVNKQCALTFGTGGIRGRLGDGPNRLNSDTIAVITQGYANYLSIKGITGPIAICYDTRLGSAEFSHVVSEVLAGNGLESLVFPCPVPTPALSFAIRKLGCDGGIVITASHNPKEYNGYKIYGADGCQITVADAKVIQESIERVSTLNEVQALSFSQGLESGAIRWMPDDILELYRDAVIANVGRFDGSNLRVVYTPLNGTGLTSVQQVLCNSGINDLHVVEEQAYPDGGFPTCPKPNPEEPEALKLGINLAQNICADLLLATDPDADRVGVAIPNGKEWRILTGNEVGLLLLEYLASERSCTQLECSRTIALTTIASSPIADELAKIHGIELRRTLTGFKFIGEQIGNLLATGRENDFLFAFEESCGYLAGTHALDKDGVEACLLVCRFAAHLKSCGQTLLDALSDLHKRYGSWDETQISITFDSSSHNNALSALLPAIRAHLPRMIAGHDVESVLDYSSGLTMPIVNAPREWTDQTLPKSNVLEMRLSGGSRVIIRPSGTEPKVKAYLFARGNTQSDAGRLLREIDRSIHSLLELAASKLDSIS